MKNLLLPIYDNNYVFAYGYGFLKEEISEQWRFAFHRNLKYYQQVLFGLTDEQICASLFEFLGLIKHSNIFTSTFHGTVFFYYF